MITLHFDAWHCSDGIATASNIMLSDAIEVHRSAYQPDSDLAVLVMRRVMFVMAVLVVFLCAAFAHKRKRLAIIQDLRAKKDHG